MSLEKMIENIESMTVGLDDTFKFHCDQCGKCCTNREDTGTVMKVDPYWQTLQVNKVAIDFSEIYEIIKQDNNNRCD